MPQEGLCLLFVVLSRASSLSMLTLACHFFLTLAGSCEPLSPDRPQSVVPAGSEGFVSGGFPWRVLLSLHKDGGHGGFGGTQGPPVAFSQLSSPLGYSGEVSLSATV